MKIIKYIMLGTILLCLFGGIEANAGSIPTIVGNSAYRTENGNATIRFLSNVDGTAYYKITSTSTVPTDIVTSGTSLSVFENTTANINITELSSGSKYVHIIVKDTKSILSNTLTIAMPHDIYYYENFEAYVEGTETASLNPYFYIWSNAIGTGRGDQKIINDNGNKVLNTSANSTGVDIRTNFTTSKSNGYIVYQANVKNSGTHEYLQYGALTLGIDNTDTRNILAGIKSLNNVFVYNSYWNSGSKIAEQNIIYNEKIVLNVAAKEYDYYVDDIKINTNPIKANYNNVIKWFGMYNGGGISSYDDIEMYVADNYYNKIIKGSETNGTFEIDKSSAAVGETITILNIYPVTKYKLKEIKILKSSDNSDVTSSVTYNATNRTFIMPNYAVKVNVEFELIPITTYTITFDSVTGVSFDKTSPIIVESGDSKEITIIADTGYKLASVKVNGVEKLSTLIANKLSLTNITANQKIVVEAVRIYNVTNGAGQKHIIGKEENAVFRIDAEKDLFSKAYLNDEELNSEFYTITEGSTIITLKQEFLNNLLPNTYNLRVTFSDGGEAHTTFIIAQPAEKNPKTGDSIMLSMIFGSISLISLVYIGTYINKKRYN